ncbi:MAG: prepilin-type N-terminal cleavage/methylation domain-containing protein [Lachnospiraceae bacterium]|nr:prepilin-type N-terminal cleavage/methylation domain-containing protein [Lachnospiraceae bacterium]
MKKIKKRCSADNRGYSMVEMIIVLAIIIIISTVGFLTMNIVNGARVSSAMNQLNAQFSFLANLTKAQSAETAMKLYFDDAKDCYVIGYGIYDNAAGTFTDSTSQSPVDLASGILIYGTVDGGTRAVVDSDGLIIQFNKSDSSVLLGYGTYEIIKNPSGKSPTESDGSEPAAATILLNKSTGSHYAK